MSGRIEHDDDAVHLRLVVCNLRASRYGVIEELEEAGTSIRSIPKLSTAMSKCIPICCWPATVGHTGGTNGSSRWNSSFWSPEGDSTSAQPPGTFSERSTTRHPSTDA